MTSVNFRKTLLFSLLGHLTVFSLFSFSFGSRLPMSNYGSVSFWGGVLKSYDFISPQPLIGLKRVFSYPVRLGDNFLKKPRAVAQEKTAEAYSLMPNYYSKPPVNLASAEDKIIFSQKAPILFAPALKKRPSVMLHPALPYYFTLYFKDRQKVHIELMFNFIPGREKAGGPVVIKRKISSGNLEVDLLAMRYMRHYLFIEQSQFAPDKWQTVKIEFSPRND